MTKGEKQERVDDAAARWAARVDRGQLTPIEQKALSDWLAEDSRHQGAFVRAQAMLVPPAPSSSQTLVHSAGSTRGRGRREWIAGIAGIAAALALTFTMLFPSPAGPETAFQTVLGEVRRVPLQDGSVITLNTASKVSVDFEQDTRLVNLVSGEGYFEVAPDPVRPFIVTTHGYQVRAVGTAFVVRRDSEESLLVLVYEGIVEVDSHDGTPMRLEAGARAELSLDGGGPRLTMIDHEQLSQELAWREGRIAFTGQTLADAASAFNRYNTTPIRVAPELATLEIVGWYSANDPAGFARVVAETMDAQAIISPQTILLKPRPCESDCP